MDLIPIVQCDPDGIWWHAGIVDTVTNATIWLDSYPTKAEAWEAANRECTTPLTIDPDEVVPLSAIRGTPCAGDPIDRMFAQRMRCPRCGKSMTYHPMQGDGHAYYAVAVCFACEIAFEW